MVIVHEEFKRAYEKMQKRRWLIRLLGLTFYRPTIADVQYGEDGELYEVHRLGELRAKLLFVRVPVRLATWIVGVKPVQFGASRCA